MAKVISQLPSGGSVPKHNNLLGLNEGDYLHLTQFEKAKLDGIQSGAEVNVNTDWNAISGDAQILNKPASFPPSTHTHTISEVVNLENELNGKASTNALDYLQLNKEDKDNKNIANGYAGLDSSGKIIPTQLPALAITDTFVVASQAEQLALVAEVGDVAVRTDLNKSFILRVTGASTLANWQELLSPTSVDQTIIDGSTNAVSGNAVFDALALKLNSVNPTTSGVVTLGSDPLAPVSGHSILTRNTATGIVSMLPSNTYRFLSDDVDWTEIANKPSTFPPSTHTHTKSQITDFAHTHPISDVTGLPTALNDLQLNKENVANKAIDFLTVNNTLYPSVQAVKGQLDLKSDKSNFINIKDLGGIGDGVFDNTTIVNNALSTYKEVYFPDGNYLVTSLVNDLGSKITGSGVIVKSIAGGTQQLNTGIDRYNYIFGQEYLSHVQNAKLSEFFVPIKVIWSGDSTTDGAGVTAEYTISSIFSRMCEVSGVSTVQSINAGHSGATTEQWRTLYLPADLAANPDLYIIRWGINDPGWLKDGTTPPIDSGDTYPNRRDIGDFETSLRSALTTIRASKTQAQMSIILMSPNPTSDTPNGRDEKWYEQVRKVYAQAARDYKCAFIDTYGLWLDSRGAAGVYMDDPFADGRAIHPLGVFNLNIVEKVFDLTFNKALLTKISDSHLYNKSSVDILPLFSANPSTYNEGLTINRVVGVDGWGLDGSAFTIYNRDNTGGQFNFSRLTANPEINFRAINFGIGESIPLSFSNSVRLWHSSNLPFSNNGEVISTTLKLGGYYNTPLDTDTPDEIFAKLPDGTNYTCYSVDTGTGVTGTPLLVTSRFLSTYGVQTASFVSGTGTGKTLTRTRDGGVWSEWKTLSFLESPTFTGTPTAPTAPAGTNNTQVATTAFVLANSPFKGIFSATGTATTTFTVTIGRTMANTSYVATPIATNTLSAVMFSVQNKTTTTFDIVVVGAGLTGAVAYDFTVTP